MSFEINISILIAATKVTDLLKANSLDFEIYDEVKANPTINVVLAGIEKFKAYGAD